MEQHDKSKLTNSSSKKNRKESKEVTVQPLSLNQKKYRVKYYKNRRKRLRKELKNYKFEE